MKLYLVKIQLILELKKIAMLFTKCELKIHHYLTIHCQNKHMQN